MRILKIPKKWDLKKFHYNIPITLTEDQINTFKDIVGEENIKRDDYSRLQVAYGKTMIDFMRLREGIVENIPDIVIHPRSKEDIEKIVKYCNNEKIPIYMYMVEVHQ